MREAPQKSIQSSTKAQIARPLLLGLLILAVAVAVLLPFAMVGESPLETQTDLTRAAPGSPARVTCEVTATTSNNLIIGSLLQRQPDGSYSRTGQTVRIQWDPNHSPVVMGTNADIRQAAVLQVSGHVGNDEVLYADQIVTLTDIITIHQ